MKQLHSKKVLTILIFLTLAVIWGHSLLGREASSEESGFVMKLLAPLLEVIVGKGNVTEHLVRKLAHFCEFFVFGAELLLFFTLSKNRKDAFLLALSHGLFTALVDETIQIFSGRGPMIPDIWLDFSGVTVGALLVFAVTALKMHKRQRFSQK
ncbi:MAG: VanZ family protein [Oscillospiraceae bacterium]|nr:VanZ family protein [Oscillospiraceae bacterium]